MPHPLYFAECRYGRLGVEFQATDRDKNSRKEIVRQIRNGSIDPVKILEIDEDAGSYRDVTDELIAEADQHREPPTHDELAERLRGMLIDRERDLRKHWGIFGW
jgi:hypothetical protein